MMKNCVFRAYVTNLGLYNEGYLVGEWVSFPLEREGMTFDESISDMLKRIKVDGKVYEEYFITDYESNVAGLTEVFGEYENLRMLNRLAEMIVESDISFQQLESMIEYAKLLAKPFPQVRVDFYDIDGKIYFGELTFTSLGGMMNYFTQQALNDMGEKINLSYAGRC